MAKSKIEVLVNGRWVDEVDYGEVVLGDTIRTTTCPDVVSRVTKIRSDEDGGVVFELKNAGRSIAN